MYNQIIAEALKNSGFKIDARQNVTIASLSRHPVYNHEIERILSANGFEDCQYTINEANGKCFIRANSPE